MDDLHKAYVLKACVWTILSTCTKKQVSKTHVYKKSMCMDDLKHLYQKASVQNARVQKSICMDDLHKAYVLKACLWTILSTCTKKQVSKTHVYKKACVWTILSTCTKKQVSKMHVYKKACVWTISTKHMY